MKRYKILVVTIVSALVAILTSIMGFTGTIIGSVISSVGYNVLVEIFEKQINSSDYNHSLDWDIAYVFPLVIIASVQLVMILGFISLMGYLSLSLFRIYSIIQEITDYNLYRIMGFALVIMCVYPYTLKSKNVQRSHGKWLLIVGILFLARGFTDAHYTFAPYLALLFKFFDLPLAIIAFVILLAVIIQIFKNNTYSSFSNSMVDEAYYSENHSHHSINMQNKRPKKVNNTWVNKRNNKHINHHEKLNGSKYIDSSSGNIGFSSRNHYYNDRLKK